MTQQLASTELTTPREQSTADHSVERAKSPVLSSLNKLKLAPFGFNIGRGPAGVTNVEGPPLIADWNEVRSIVVAAENAGFDAVIPVGRWKGFGGDSKFWDRSFETFTWAAAIAEATDRIGIFTTAHIGITHPVYAAKMGATIDHISGGRWGLNVVAGWLGAEFDMFGGLPPHVDRYRLAAEWLDIIRRLWTEPEEFDYDGEFFQLKGAISEPKPVQSPYPPIMNAGQSPSGQAFATQHSDLIFIGLQEGYDTKETIDNVRSKAAENGREVNLWGVAHIVCRDTEQEARDFIDYYAGERGDYETAKRYAASLMAGDTPSHDIFRRDSELMRQVQATAGNRGSVGSPEQVVEQLKEFSDAGLDGCGIVWIDFLEGIRQYEEKLLPLMRDAGLRA
jgi:FMNH2-dependent dimethyl sulfone monooxygenase